MKSEGLLRLLLIVVAVSCASKEEAKYQEPRMRHGIVPKEKKKSQNIQAWMNEAQIARGKLLYSMNCLECHGPQGLGDGVKAKKLKAKPMNLVELVEDVPDFTFFLAISQWSGEMPGWKEPFSSEEREDLVAYIKTFARKN